MNDGLEQKLLQSIGSDLSPVAEDVADMAFDAIVDSGLLKEISVIGAIVRLSKVGLTINSYLYGEKVRHLLFQLNKIPLEERVSFLKKLDEKPNERKRFSETIF